MLENYTNEIIEDLMQKFEPVIGEDFSSYKNHVYRVYYYCCLLEEDSGNEEKYAIAAVFHDIGIWTNSTFDYLYPSMEQVKIYLTENGKAEWIDEICLMINWHHKMSEYHGEYEKTVETFRKSDWIDVSLGLKTFGCNKQKMEAIKMAKPYLGFQMFLLKKSMKNFIKHPLNPLPMFKK